MALGDVRIRYLESGTGSGVVLAHCSGGSHRQWSSFLPSLTSGHRVLAPDLLGDGGSSPWPASEPWPATRDEDVIESMIDRAGGAAHLVGHSYGAAVCLELARRDALARKGRVLSLFLIEPVSFHLLRGLGDGEDWRRVERLASTITARVERGDLAGAARGFMGFWLGHARWFLAPRSLRTRVMRTMPKVAAEFRLLAERRESLSDHGAIDCPVTLLEGQRSPRVAKAVVRALAATLPDVRAIELSGAGHMSPFSHPERVRELLTSHLARAPAPPHRSELRRPERLSA